MSEGREERFTTLYGWARPRLVAYAMRRTASREDAADVVAETFAIAWRRLDDVPEGEAGLLWLYVTARHVLSNHGRRLRRRGDLTARLADELAGIEVGQEARDEEGLVALLCLHSLPADEREILMLAGWEGLGAGEMGRVLGCSPTAARIRLHRARARLKAEIAGLATLEKQLAPIRHVRGGGAPSSFAPEEASER